MGFPSRRHDHARHRADARGRPDRGKAAPRLSAAGAAPRLIALLTLGVWLALGPPAGAEPLRVAAWAGEFSRKGPGLLLRDLLSPDPLAGLDTLLRARADVILLTDLDYDAGGAALTALRDQLAASGLHYPHAIAARPNTGMQTDRDLDGDGRTGGPRDAQGFGWFSGQSGLAVLSRHPLTLRQDRSATLWREVPDSAMAPDDPGADIQRLASTAFWAVTVAAPGGPVTLLTLDATPPVFDGPEDRNGRRNRDEALFWLHALDGRTEPPPPDAPVILLGNLNIDPARGDGYRATAARVLAHPRLQDPLPGTPTVSWDATGPMRVVYVLPDARLPVADAGVLPAEAGAGPHRLVWVDLADTAAD